MKRLIIDRFEGQFAVCEQSDRTMINIDKNLIPSNAQEGDCLLVDDSGIINLDSDETMKRKERIQKLMDDLFE
ncbi:DUF3006 domain-containing protein [Anaerocolumna sp. MB42-C2]|uniref:DUF3006 domain-containing protein n=1 Tax=Anaerocolumna sp. MB42-C2 TaxID=3070997 RepID=UPI0027DFA3CF|nr:DUF3006 domain-containing protein [Anaerocolumna sp. MB42-C2]WMJ86731.1 DUF3006 domain-containing protein [Anaerocolumna sp. MB42-C2]